MVRQDNRIPVALLPGLRRLRAYQPTGLRGDLLAGVMVAAHLMPQCMDYAALAGVASGGGAVGDPAAAAAPSPDRFVTSSRWGPNPPRP